MSPLCLLYRKGSPHERLHSYFTFEHYQYFDYTKNKGKKLVNILQDLMLYEDNTLSASSAALLFDIYNVSLSSCEFNLIILYCRKRTSCFVKHKHYSLWKTKNPTCSMSYFAMQLMNQIIGIYFT